MFCKRCGKENQSDSTFCLFCGEPLTVPAPATPQQRVNMWGEPIDDLTQEFQAPAVPLSSVSGASAAPTEDDLSATRVVNTGYLPLAGMATDLPAREERAPAPVSPDTEERPRPKKKRNENRGLIIGVVVATAMVAIALLAWLTVSIFFPSNDAKGNSNFTYEIVDSSGNAQEVHILSYKGQQTTVTIPSMIEGKPVTYIGEQAFANRNLWSVTVPNSVRSIMDSAFDGNPELVLYGGERSYVQYFAERKGILFAVKGSPRPTRSTLSTTATTSTSTTATTTQTTSTTVTTSPSTTATQTPPTYAQPQVPVAGTNPQAPAFTLLGLTFTEVKGLLGNDYHVQTSTVVFPQLSLLFSGDSELEPAEDDRVIAIVIWHGCILDRAYVGDSKQLLQIMLQNTTEWRLLITDEGLIRYGFEMTYNGKLLNVELMFDGEGDEAICTGATVMVIGTE